MGLGFGHDLWTCFAWCTSKGRKLVTVPTSFCARFNEDEGTTLTTANLMVTPTLVTSAVAKFENAINTAGLWGKHLLRVWDLLRHSKHEAHDAPGMLVLFGFAVFVLLFVSSHRCYRAILISNLDVVRRLAV